MPDKDPTTGKFVKGNSYGGAKPGAGRKPLIQKELLDRAVSEMDWILIYSKLRDQALQGDVKAAEFLDIRRFGKPVQNLEISGPDGAAIQTEEIGGMTDSELEKRIKELEKRARSTDV